MPTRGTSGANAADDVIYSLGAIGIMRNYVTPMLGARLELELRIKQKKKKI